MRLNRRDLTWTSLVALSFAVGIAASWQRWGSPLVDCGREMNQPLRMLRGEWLYSDIKHLYGPLSPWLHTLLYDLCGPSLDVLRGSGMVTALLILALIYLLARRLMEAPGAAAATLGVTWLCALKQAGNYILPYAFSAVHGCALSLATCACAAAFVVHERRRWLWAAGILSGLTFLAKTEMGAAALVASAAAALLAGRSGLGPGAQRLTIVLTLALGLPAAVYSWIALHIGWTPLLDEGYLLGQNVPASLVFFNKRMFGLDHPWRSLGEMLVVAARVALLMTLTAAVSLRWARPENETRAHLPVRLAWALAGLLVLVTVTGRSVEWERGPYLAMPLVLVLLLALTARRGLAERRATGHAGPETRLVALLSLYAVASLARTILRVRTGGAYSSYLLPPAVIVFTYLWAAFLPATLPRPAARLVARRIGLGLLFGWLAIAAGITVARYRMNYTYPIHSARGTLVTLPDFGLAFEQAMSFIAQRTAPGDPVAVLPEGTSLLFFTDRRNPINEEITTPGFLDEDRAIQRLIATHTRLILITNRPTPEFGATAFGRDFNQRPMNWIEQHYDVCAVFGREPLPRLAIGDPPFFIKAYCLRRDQRSIR